MDRADHPDPQAFDVDSTPGTALIAAAAFPTRLRARGRPGSPPWSVPAASPSSAIMTATAMARGGIAPGITQSRKPQPDNDGDRAQHVGGEMQRVGRQRLGLLVSCAARCSARPASSSPRCRPSSTMNGIAEIVGGGTPSAQAAPGSDQNAARQHIKHGDHAECVSPKGEHAGDFRFYCASGGSAWLITRFTVGNARRNARSIASTFS